MFKDRVAIVKPNHCAMKVSFQNLSLKTTFGVGQMIHHRGWLVRQMEMEKLPSVLCHCSSTTYYVAFRSGLAKKKLY